MKKSITLICLVSTFSLLGGLVACNPGNSGNSSDSTSTGGITPPVGSVQVNFWHTFGQGIVDVLDAKAKEFAKLVKENEGVDVTINLAYQGSYDDIVNKISQGFSAGNIPTIAVAYPDHVANYLAAEPNDGDYVTNLQTLMDDPKIGLGKEAYLNDNYGEFDITPAFLEEGRQFIKEGTYTLPYMKSSEVMFYNEEAVYTALKLQNPDYVGTAADFLNDITWDEFIEFNEFVNEHKKEILSPMTTPIFYDSDSNLFITKMYQNEIAYSSIGADEKGVIDFESGKARSDAEAMVLKLKEQHDKGLLTTKGLEGKYGSDYFTQMQSIFSIGSSGGAGYNFPTSDTFTVGVCKVPYDNNNPMYVSQGPSLCMLKNPADNAEVTNAKTIYGWKFIKYLLTPENNVQICISGSEGYIPVRTSAFSTDAYLEFLEGGEGFAKTAYVLLEEIEGHYLNTPVFTGSAKLRDEVGGIITQVLNGNKEVSKAFEDAINTTKLAM